MKSKKWITLSFLGIVIVFFICNIALVSIPMEKFLDEETDFTEFRDSVQEELKSDQFSFKNHFINFNGWFSKMLGKRVINEVAITDNGMLIPVDVQRIEMGLYGQKMAHTDAVLKEMGIPFVYIQAPSKVDLEKKILPTGVKNHWNENADSFLAELLARNVKNIDLRPDFCATVEDVEKYFYKTDHHWNYAAAFKAYQMLMPVIQEMLGDFTDVSRYTDIESWEKYLIPNTFLGSRGRRVGIHVVGTDDYEYYTPRFATDMTLEVVQEQKWYKGSFEDCIIREEKLDPSKGYFENSEYHAFIGSDYGLVKHKNKQPAINKKILIIKDSFVLPLQAFVSTVFGEVDVIDLRHYTQMSLIEYIYASQPDAVIWLHYPGTFTWFHDYNYGYEEYDGLKERTQFMKDSPLLEQDKIVYEVPNHDYCFEPVSVSLEPQTSYTLEIGGLTVHKGEVDCVSVKLYDNKTGQFLLGKVFDPEEDSDGYKWFFKTPDMDCSDVQLQFYCGESGKTAGVAVDYENVVLYKGWDIEDNENKLKSIDRSIKR